MRDEKNRIALMYTAVSLVASAINYSYYPAMGHLLHLAEYGELQVIISIVMQFGTITICLSVINVNLIANNDRDESVSLVIALQRAAFWFAVAISAALFAVTESLKAYFHFSSTWPFLLIAPILLVQVVSSFWIGYLQGHRDFIGVSAYGLSIGAGKLFFSAALVAAGLGLFGGIAGFALGLLSGLAITRCAARRPLPRLRQALLWPNDRERRVVRTHFAYVAEVVVTLFAMSLLLSIDTLLVKHLFSRRFAGQYAGVATVARITFFAAAPLVTVMIPSISLDDRAGARKVFRHTMAITLGICAIGVAGTVLFSSAILAMLLGPGFVPRWSWLPPLTLMASSATVTNVMVNYLLALRSHGGVVVSLASLAVTALMIPAFHATVFQIIGSTLTGLLAGQLVFCVFFLHERKIARRPLVDGRRLLGQIPERATSHVTEDRTG